MKPSVLLAILLMVFMINSEAVQFDSLQDLTLDVMDTRAAKNEPLHHFKPVKYLNPDECLHKAPLVKMKIQQGPLSTPILKQKTSKRKVIVSNSDFVIDYKIEYQ